MQNRLLLNLASLAIKEEFTKKCEINKELLLKEHFFLNDTLATFVTLTINGKLRGCIGSLNAKRSLLEDVIFNAKHAAFSDLRFDSLTYDEYENIQIEISILTQASLLQYNNIKDLKTKIKPNIHGVILEYEGKKATFLPQVWEQLLTFEEFFEHLCLKAFLNINCLNQGALISTYEVQKIK